MSYTNEFDVEFAPDGELTIPDYDWEQDDLMVFMTGQKSNARQLIEDYENDPLTMFNVVGLKDVSRIEMVVAGRAFYEEIVRLSGVSEIEGCDITVVGKAVYEAVIVESGFKLADIMSGLELCGKKTLSDYWKEKNASYGVYGFSAISSPRYAVIRSAIYLCRVADKTNGVRSYWEERGRRAARDVFGDLGGSIVDLIDNSHDLSQKKSWRVGELPIPQRFVPDAKKLMVGAAVRAIGALRQRLGYAGEHPGQE
jgi:hypothetical protein